MKNYNLYFWNYEKNALIIIMMTKRISNNNLCMNLFSKFTLHKHNDL